MMRKLGMKRGRRALAAIAIATFTAGARAQETPASVQGLENFSLQPSRPTPTPQPEPTGTPRPAPALTVPAIVVPVPVPSATSKPVATPTPRPSSRAAAPAPAPSMTAQAVPEPTTTPIPAPIPVPSSPVSTTTPAATAAPQAAALGGIPVGAIVAGALALAALAVALLLRRRRVTEVTPVGETPDVPPVHPEPAPVAPAPRFLEPTPPPTAERAWIELSVTARRAGVNLLTATADVDVTLHNIGSAVASAVRLDVRLRSARAGQDDELGALFGTPVDRPATPPFDLAPGEARTIRTLATLPRDAINVLTAGDRPMFVPILAVNARYAVGEAATGQTAAAWAIGIERDGAAKLAPFWLDGPTRMHDTLAVRPHALALKR